MSVSPNDSLLIVMAMEITLACRWRKRSISDSLLERYPDTGPPKPKETKYCVNAQDAVKVHYRRYHLLARVGAIEAILTKANTRTASSHHTTLSEYLTMSLAVRIMPDTAHSTHVTPSIVVFVIAIFAGFGSVDRV